MSENILNPGDTQARTKSLAIYGSLPRLVGLLVVQSSFHNLTGDLSVGARKGIQYIRLGPCLAGS